MAAHMWCGHTVGISAMTSMWNFTVFLIVAFLLLHQVKREVFFPQVILRHDTSSIISVLHGFIFMP